MPNVPRTLADTRLAQLGFVSDKERIALSQVALPIRSLVAGEDLVRQASSPENIYLLVSGWAYRYVTVRDRVRQISALLIPGDICNLDNLLFVRADCGVQALTGATVLVLPREKALHLAAEHPGIGRAFTWLALAENAILSQWAAGLGRRSAEERLAHLLCELSIRSGVASDGGNLSKIELPLSHQVIGDAVGLTADSVDHTMESLCSKGLISSAGTCLTVLNLDELRSLAHFDASYLQQIEESARAAGPTSRKRMPTSGRNKPDNDGETTAAVNFAESSPLHDARSDEGLLLREANHRFSSDLELIISLLDLQSRRAKDEGIYRALRDAMERVEVLAHARQVAADERPSTLNSALQHVCEALNTQAGPRSISIIVAAPSTLPPLPSEKISTLALVVNELATNAIKHAFDENLGGQIWIRASEDAGELKIVVDDDGRSLPSRATIIGAGVGLRLGSAQGLGLGLAEQLMASIGGRLIPPGPNSKAFELRVPSGRFGLASPG